MHHIQHKIVKDKKPLLLSWYYSVQSMCVFMCLFHISSDCYRFVHINNYESCYLNNSKLSFFVIFVCVNRISGNTEAPAQESHQNPVSSLKRIPPPPQSASRIQRKPSKSPLCHLRRHALQLTHRLCPTRTCTRLFSHALALLAVWGVWEHLEGKDLESKMAVM